MALRMRGGNGLNVAQVDKTAFARAVLTKMEEHGDIASEALWQELALVLMEYWLVFQGDQSPLSTWGMVGQCSDRVLKIRAVSRGVRGESGTEALEQFRSFMGEVLGDEDKER